MIGKLLLFLLGMILLIVFAWFNYDNVSDISFGFRTFTDIPVFISIFLSFIAGAFFSIPFAYFGRRRQKLPKKMDKQPADSDYFDDAGRKEKRKLKKLKLPRPGFKKKKLSSETFNTADVISSDLPVKNDDEEN